MSYYHQQAFTNMTGGRRNRTALHYASIANNVAIVKVLLKFNADQEVIDTTGYTALNLSNGGEVCRLLHKVIRVSRITVNTMRAFFTTIREFHVSNIQHGL